MQHSSISFEFLVLLLMRHNICSIYVSRHRRLHRKYRGPPLHVYTALFAKQLSGVSMTHFAIALLIVAVALCGAQRMACFDEGLGA